MTDLATAQRHCPSSPAAKSRRMNGIIPRSCAHALVARWEAKELFKKVLLQWRSACGGWVDIIAVLA